MLGTCSHWRRLRGTSYRLRCRLGLQLGCQSSRQTPAGEPASEPRHSYRVHLGGVCAFWPFGTAHRRVPLDSLPHGLRHDRLRLPRHEHRRCSLCAGELSTSSGTLSGQHRLFPLFAGLCLLIQSHGVGVGVRLSQLHANLRGSHRLLRPSRPGRVRVWSCMAKAVACYPPRQRWMVREPSNNMGGRK